jgi:Domain of unknown function (DUF4232)
VIARPHWLVAAVALAALVLVGGGSSASVAPCTGSQLAGNFVVIPGSAGAGSISYRLNVRFVSGRACFVSGLPHIQLLSRLRRPLPTKVVAAFRQGLPAPRVVLRPGYEARAQARFSPDVPGVGEPVAGRNCERTAYSMRVTLPPGGATFLAPVRPPTPVCEHGTMTVSALRPARP